MTTTSKVPIVNGAGLQGVQDLMTIPQVYERITGVVDCLTPDRSSAARVAGMTALLSLGKRQNEILAGVRSEGLKMHIAVNAAGVAIVHVLESVPLAQPGQL